MKKNGLIILVVLTTVVVILLMNLKSCEKADEIADNQNEVSYSVNDSVPQNPFVDDDEDGVSKADDPNDWDPCNPNKECELCDFDDDGLTFKMENEKGTDPENDDSDYDGVKDVEDKCPTDGEGSVDDNGCPVDSDGDGVYDRDDKCPHIAGKNKNGCELLAFNLKYEYPNNFYWDRVDYDGELWLNFSTNSKKNFKSVNVTGKTSIDFQSFPTTKSNIPLMMSLELRNSVNGVKKKIIKDEMKCNY